MIACTDVVLRFPLLDRAHAWRLLFGDVDRFKAVTAIDGVSLDVMRGRFLGVLGVNGSGKSTLLRIVGGVYAPTRGVVRVVGSVSGLFELGGFGNRNISGEDYATRYLQIYGAAREQLPALLADIAGFSELGAKFQDRIYTYSSGMAARLYFATATALDYDIYLIDEVLSVGDEHFQAKCWGRLRERFARGASGIFVTHDWSSVLKLCDSAMVLQHGRVVDSGRADRVVCDYLGLEAPAARDARLECATEHHAVCGEDLHLAVDVISMRDIICRLHCSIEAFSRGAGWQVMLIMNDEPVCSTRGRHALEINIDDLPLAPGRYSLNLFLTTVDAAAGGAVELADVRSWTYGTGLELHVEGAPSDGCVVPPHRWEVARH